MKGRKFKICTAACAAVCLFSGCSRVNGAYYADKKTYADYDLAHELGISFDTDILGSLQSDLPNFGKEDNTANYDVESPGTFRMRVVDSMPIYEQIGDSTVKLTLKDGDIVDLTETDDGVWAAVQDTDGTFLGYAREGFLHTVDSDCQVYGELPVEYGQAKTNEETYVDAYSHLVDIRKYLRVYSSTDESNEGVDLSEYDVKVSMKLSTDDTSIHEPFYHRNLCMVQYDVIQKLKQAIDIFRADGYTVVIYDAYRPTSVQQRWFDVIRVHKWVADPSIGMGGIHDRGTAFDMSLIDSDGKELEMPTPMHTFTDASARDSAEMTDEARKNMDYMKDVMVSCGFTYINSEWWHFQDVNTQYYLPTDHPIDSIPLVASEN